MRIPALLTVLALVSTGFLHPAAADSTMAQPLTAAQPQAMSPEACLAHAKGDDLAQLACCKDHKGVCGCRAGKIVCCDNTTSNEPGCTCHGDEGIAE